MNPIMNRPKQRFRKGADHGLDLLVLKSARIIIPILLEEVRVDSVLDVGCGTGIWLRAFRENGVDRIKGIDGPWIPEDSLNIPAENFEAIDFYEQRLSIAERFDLAVCLEVFEHLDPSISDALLQTLCKASGVILFSAAIPGQRGYKHINECYQDYWIWRFRKFGFHAYDLIRPKVWMNEDVLWWYQQNCLVFANESAAEEHNLQRKPFMQNVVHPVLYQMARKEGKSRVKSLIRRLGFDRVFR